jgi:hypothetical protein
MKVIYRIYTAALLVLTVSASPRSTVPQQPQQLESTIAVPQGKESLHAGSSLPFDADTKALFEKQLALTIAEFGKVIKNQQILDDIDAITSEQMKIYKDSQREMIEEMKSSPELRSALGKLIANHQDDLEVVHEHILKNDALNGIESAQEVGMSRLERRSDFRTSLRTAWAIISLPLKVAQFMATIPYGVVILAGTVSAGTQLMFQIRIRQIEAAMNNPQQAVQDLCMLVLRLPLTAAQKFIAVAREGN